MKKKPAIETSIATVTASSAAIPACAPLVCAEFGLPKHTGHARTSVGQASRASVFSAIAIFLIPNP